MLWPLQEDALDRSDLEELQTFIRETNRFTQGPKVKEFEHSYAAWEGCRYCVFVNSGSSANLLLVNALKELSAWRDSDEVIVPAVTWSTSAAPVIQNGLEPVFVDVNLEDLSFDYTQIERCLTEKTRAIFVTHLLGFPANIPLLKKIIGDRNILIMEDCCESHGATINSIKVGNFGVGGTFSAYWGHHMTTIEGGMICTNNEELYKMLLIKRSHGLARELPPQYHDEIKKQYPDIDFRFLFLTSGFNLRNTEMHAVLGLAQLKRLGEVIEIRSRNYTRFTQICKKYQDALILPEARGVSSFALPFIFRESERMKRFQEKINLAGIESRPLISGNLLRHPFLRKYYDASRFPNADFLHSNAFYIGNNQFVDENRLQLLETLMNEFFSSAA
jgi:CDP-6-deoxy-D-xylo-4-hexulose-3-dehydrase